VFEWDGDNIGHIGGHGVSIEEAEQALLDEGRVPSPAYQTSGERRSAVLGSTEEGRLLFVVYTFRRGLIRVVTARDATANEGRSYRRRRRR